VTYVQAVPTSSPQTVVSTGSCLPVRHLPKPHGHLDIGKPEIAMRDLVGHVQVSIRTTQVVFGRGQFTNQRSSG
jgi:hypothetical protein